LKFVLFKKFKHLIILKKYKEINIFSLIILNFISNQSSCILNYIKN
jgi:hypothetical protein